MRWSSETRWRLLRPQSFLISKKQQRAFLLQVIISFYKLNIQHQFHINTHSVKESSPPGFIILRLQNLFASACNFVLFQKYSAKNQKPDIFYLQFGRNVIRPLKNKTNINILPQKQNPEKLLASYFSSFSSCLWCSGLLLVKVGSCARRFLLLNSQWERVKISAGQTDKTTLIMFNNKVPVHTHTQISDPVWVFYWSRETMMDLGWDQVWFGYSSVYRRFYWP